MKIVKELKEQYAYLWWWLLNQGIIISSILVNTFLFFIFMIAMAVLHFILRWFKGH